MTPEFMVSLADSMIQVASKQARHSRRDGKHIGKILDKPFPPSILSLLDTFEVVELHAMLP